jgi:Fe-S cluster biogenesis protein NfuA
MYLQVTDKEKNMEDKVKEAIEAIRPSLQNDGGDIEFIKLEGNTVTVRLVGACAGCPMSQMTLKNGVERYLKHTVDENLVVENEMSQL